MTTKPNVLEPPQTHVIDQGNLYDSSHPHSGRNEFFKMILSNTVFLEVTNLVHCSHNLLVVSQVEKWCSIKAR